MLFFLYQNPRIRLGEIMAYVQVYSKAKGHDSHYRYVIFELPGRLLKAVILILLERKKL